MEIFSRIILSYKRTKYKKDLVCSICLAIGIVGLIMIKIVNKMEP